jgi:transcriptional regulator with XRE-family HTH domain
MGFAAFLDHELKRRQRRNPRYSLRAFARDLGCDHSTLSQWMRGSRPLSPDSIAQLAHAMRLDEARLAYCREFDPLAGEVIAAAVDCARPTTPGIAGLLGVTADRVNIVLHRLLRLGVMRMEDGRWVIEPRRMPG